MRDECGAFLERCVDESIVRIVFKLRILKKKYQQTDFIINIETIKFKTPQNDAKLRKNKVECNKNYAKNKYINSIKS